MDCTSGNSNVAVGHNAGQNVTTGVRNVLVGFTAGDSITTGNNNTIIGDIAGIGYACQHCNYWSTEQRSAYASTARAMLALERHRLPVVFMH